MNKDLYNRTRKELKMCDNELNLSLRGEKVTYYDHENLTSVNGRDGYFGYRRAWHMFHYSTCVDKEEFNNHWEDEGYNCTYTAFVHFILWKQGYTQKDWKDHFVDIERKSMEEQWVLFDKVKE